MIWVYLKNWEQPSSADGDIMDIPPIRHCRKSQFLWDLNSLCFTHYHLTCDGLTLNIGLQHLPWVNIYQRTGLYHTHSPNND